MRNAAYSYRQHSVQGASPVSLVVMLYDGAIAALRRAITAIEAHDIEKKCAHLNRALAIIAQLEGSLDFETGGEVAQTLKQLYVHARTSILQANIQDSQDRLAALVEQFSGVREAWEKVERSGPTPRSSVSAPASDPSPSQVARVSLLKLVV